MMISPVLGGQLLSTERSSATKLHPALPARKRSGGHERDPTRSRQQARGWQGEGDCILVCGKNRRNARNFGRAGFRLPNCSMASLDLARGDPTGKAGNRGKSKSDDNSAFRDQDAPIPVAVDTFETPKPAVSPKAPTVLHFATRTPLSQLRNVRDTCGILRTLANALRTLADTKATTFDHFLDPSTPTLKLEPLR